MGGIGSGCGNNDGCGVVADIEPVPTRLVDVEEVAVDGDLEGFEGDDEVRANGDRVAVAGEASKLALGNPTARPFPAVPSSGCFPRGVSGGFIVGGLARFADRCGDFDNEMEGECGNRT